MTKTLEDVEKELAEVEADVNALKAPAEPTPAPAPEAPAATGFISTSFPMPLYQCHKQVNAGKITAIQGNTLVCGVIAQQFVVSDAWMQKNQPQIGGYFIAYPLEQGETVQYTSYSPALAFENGYSKL